MKKFGVIAVAVVLLGSSLVPVAQAAIEVTGDAYVGVYDKYLFRGIDLSQGRPVVQHGADLSALGFTLSYWQNVQLKDVAGEATETDVILDYTYDVNDLVSVSAGNIFYSFNVPGSTNELYLGVALNTLLSPSFTLYYDWDLADDLGVDGLYYAFSVGHTFEVMENLGVNLGALVSINQENPSTDLGNTYSGFHNYELSISADYAVTDQVSITPSFLWSDALSDDAEKVIKDEILVGLAATFSF